MSLHLALGLAVGLSACSEPSPGSGTGGDEGEADALRLGRVHVVLATADDDAPDAFELTARFAMVRGLEEEFVRARADMPDLAIDLLSPGQCASESALWPSEVAAETPESTDEAGQELLLVDAGELEVRLGAARLEVPLALVPDLLPYMSGVEYAYFAEDADVAALNEADRLTVIAAGGLTEELPAFSADSSVPGPIDLQYTAEDLASVDAGALAFRWSGRANDTEAVLTLRFTPLLDGEPLGDDIVCLAADGGQTRFDLAVLRTLGFAPDADGVRIQGSRTETSLFDAGAWAGTELVVERVDVTELPLR